jgi:hypothetical protein
MKWNGIIDLTPSASGSQTNTAGNIRNQVIHKGAAFPSGTSIPQQGQIYYFTGSSTQSIPSPATYVYDGSSWQPAGGHVWGAQITGLLLENRTDDTGCTQIGRIWLRTDI